jgi:hypothetical protein
VRDWAIGSKIIEIVITEARRDVTPKSGGLLMVSCVAAIAAVGSVFELSSGVPDLGTPVTAGILALSIPATIVSFYAAVQDARANQR